MDDTSQLEEKRLRRKAKNRAKKEDSKRAREEEIRRKLYEPKNRRVRLVDAREAETMRGTHGPATLASPVAVSSEDFPNLGSPARKSRPDNRKVRDEASRVQTHEVNGELSRTDDTSAGGVVNAKRETWEEAAMEQPTNQGVTTNPNAKPRRADPIKIDLMSVLKKSSVTVEKKVPLVAVKKKAPSQLHGNQLDSSNPERKKGKTRENPKPQKPSHLKAVILQDRKARQASRAQAEMTVAVDGLEGKSTTVAPSLAEKVENPEVPLQELTNKNEISSKASMHSAPTNIEASEGSESRTVDVGKVTPDIVVDSKENVVEDRSVSLPKEIVQNMSALRIDQDKTAVSMHSRKFRDYCDHVPSPELDGAVTALIADIVRFQDRSYFSDPVKAHAKRRFVLGFRETGKYLRLKKLKLLVIAPDLETARSEGGIEDTVAGLKDAARSQDVPYVFSVARGVLRKLTNKSCGVKGISCVGVINYEGSQDNYHAIQSVLPELRSRYQRLVNPDAEDPTPSPALTPTPAPTCQEPLDVNEEVVATFLVKLTKELENE